LAATALPNNYSLRDWLRHTGSVTQPLQPKETTMKTSTHILIAGRPACKRKYISEKISELMPVNVNADFRAHKDGILISDLDLLHIGRRRPALYAYAAADESDFDQMKVDVQLVGTPCTVFLRLPTTVEARRSRRPQASDVPERWRKYFGSAILLFRASNYDDSAPEGIEEIPVTFDL
jgi:hypothetical protein